MPVTKIRAAYKAAFTHPQAFTTTIITALLDLYGTEALTWDPETIRLELAGDLDVSTPPANFDRLMQGIELLTSDAFYKSLPDFIQACNILAGDTYDPEAWDPADSREVAWGITEALLLSPPEEDDENPFIPDITAYIGEVLDAEGIITPPDVLRIATRQSGGAAAVAGIFSDDPIMFDMVYETERSKTDDINQAVRTGLTELSQQLEALPLRNGSTKDIVKKIHAAISSNSAQGAT